MEELIINKHKNNKNYSYNFLTSVEGNHLLRDKLDYDFIAEKLSDFDIVEFKFAFRLGYISTNDNVYYKLKKFFGYNIEKIDGCENYYVIYFDKRNQIKYRKEKIKKLL